MLDLDKALLKLEEKLKQKGFDCFIGQQQSFPTLEFFTRRLYAKWSIAVEKDFESNVNCLNLADELVEIMSDEMFVQIHDEADKCYPVILEHLLTEKIVPSTYQESLDAPLMGLSIRAYWVRK